MCYIEPLFYKVEDGSKTKTRRIMNPQPDWIRDGKPICESNFRDKRKRFVNEDGEHFFEIKPKYKVGDIVYLKEPYRIENGYFSYKFSEKRVKFTGNPKDLEKLLSQQEKSKSVWLNKLFMPESAARVFIEITEVRTERLQDISEKDCIKEGIFYAPIQITPLKEELTIMWSNGLNSYETPKKAYAAIIDHINGKGTWDSNPWVYVYEFKLYDKI